MERREFIAGAGLLLGTTCVLGVPAADDVAAIKQLVQNVYSVYYQNFDKQKYRSLLTEDYLLLENGELLDIEGDIAMMPAADSGYKRKDTFDFRSVKVHGDTAYAVYFLKSETNDKNGVRNREWLESVVMRRSGGRWRMALLHSTRIVKTAT